MAKIFLSKKLRSIIKLLPYIGGMPFAVDEDVKNGRILFRKSLGFLLWTFLFNTFLFSIPFLIILILTYISDINWVQIQEVIMKDGMNPTDAVVKMMFFALIFFIYMRVTITLSRLTEEFNAFARASWKVDLVDMSRKTYVVKKAGKRLILIMLSYVPAGISFGVAAYLALDLGNVELGTGTRIMLAVIIGLWFLFVLVPMPNTVCILMLTQGFNAAIIVVEEYTNIIKNLTVYPRKKTSHEEKKIIVQEVNPSYDPDISVVIDEGHKILDVVQACNESYGTLAFEECVSSMSFMTFCIYLGSSVFFDNKTTPLDIGIALSLTDFTLVGIHLYRLIYCVRHGQQIEDKFGMAVRSIREAMVRNVEAISYKEYCQLADLKERFVEIGGIRPRNVFRLNKSMVLSAATTIFTYIIVLLQFKVSS